MNIFMDVTLDHYPIDHGFCKCGLWCKTADRFRTHLDDVKKKQGSFSKWAEKNRKQKSTKYVTTE